ncbi:hypothetical protein GOODEAATRI_020045, partial [Goodea atripinnis]
CSHNLQRVFFTRLPSYSGWHGVCHANRHDLYSTSTPTKGVAGWLLRFNDGSWLGWRAERRRERLSLKACVWAPVSLFQCPVMPPLNPAKTSSQHPGCIKGDKKQTL